MSYHKASILLLFFTLVITKAKNLCETEDAGSFSHESDCKQFYICQNGKPVLFECPKDLEYNAATKTCDPPKIAGCINGKNDTIPEDHRRCGNHSMPVCPNHDPNELAVHLLHPTDCRLFYKCNWGEAFLLDCHTGLHFDNRNQLCDYPHIAKCNCKYNPTP